MENKYGIMNYMDDSGNTKEIAITDFLQMEFIDHRLISTCKIEDGSYFLAVENPESTGRSIRQSMHLSEESLIGLLMCITLYFDIKNINLQGLIEKTDNDLINYTMSDNLKDLQ